MPTFSTTFTPPPAPSGLTIEADLDLSAVHLTWDASAVAQVDFAGFRVYRSRDNGVTFELLAVLPLVTDTEYHDYEAPLNVTLVYRLTQSNLDFESEPVEGTVELSSLMWWVVVPGDIELTFPIPKVRAASMTSTKVQDVYSPIGRPTRIAVGDVVQTESGELSFLAMPDNPGLAALLRRVQARMDGAVILKAPDSVVHHVQYGDMTRAFTNIPGVQELTIPFTGVG